jgi:hypothetical protein
LAFLQDIGNPLLPCLFEHLFLLGQFPFKVIDTVQKKFPAAILLPVARIGEAEVGIVEKAARAAPLGKTKVGDESLSKLVAELTRIHCDRHWTSALSPSKKN